LEETSGVRESIDGAANADAGGSSGFSLLMADNSEKLL